VSDVSIYTSFAVLLVLITGLIITALTLIRRGIGLRH